jgi:hypothetical protein
LRPSALKRLKDTYRDNGVLLPAMSRHVMKSITSDRPDDHSLQHMHPSDLAKADWCGRHDFYRMIGCTPEKTSARNPSFTMENIFAEGHAIHGKYQTWLWEMGVLFGDWKCLECNHRWGALSPRVCQFCLSERIVYKELPMRHNAYRVEGHADAAVHADWYRGLVEIKSIGINSLRFEAPRLYQRYLNGVSADEIWRDISRPFASHLRQGMFYLWMTWPSYEQIVFIYESKFNQQTKEFLVQYNKSLIDPVLEEVRDVAHAVRSGSPPPRPHWAEAPDSNVCTSCVYRKRCWDIGALNGAQAQAEQVIPTVRVDRTSGYRRRRALRKA